MVLLSAQPTRPTIEGPNVVERYSSLILKCSTTENQYNAFVEWRKNGTVLDSTIIFLPLVSMSVVGIYEFTCIVRKYGLFSEVSQSHILRVESTALFVLYICVFFYIFILKSKIGIF